MKKRRIKEEQRKARKSNSQKILEDGDVQIFKVLLNRLKEKYNASSLDIVNLAQEEVMIPASIFTDRLSPLEIDVKYLKENLGFEYSHIADLLGRSRKAVWQAHKNAVKKVPELLKAEETEFLVPVSAFKEGLSILEATVVYLKQEHGLSYHKIGELLQRNERTIWTVYSRAMKKK